MSKNFEVELLMSEIRFEFARSSGPGGQNVNKSNTKAILIWDPSKSDWLPAGVYSRLMAKYNRYVGADEIIKIECEDSRSQIQNRVRAENILIDMLESVWVPPKKRIPTKVPRASKVERLQQKKGRATIKKNRSRPTWDD